MIREATLLDLQFIAERMRRRDIQELAATRGAVDPTEIARDAYASPWAFIATGRDHTPVMAVGAKPAHHGVVSVWGYGTDGYRQGVREMTNHCWSVMVPAIISSGFHRAQCVVHPENTGSQRWLQSLGFYPEAILRRFGTGTDMLLYAWVLDEPDDQDP